MEIKEVSANAIQQISEYIKSGIEFGIAQAPDVAQQFLAYELVKMQIWAGLGTLISLLLIWPAVKWTIEFWKDGADTQPATIVIIAIWLSITSWPVYCWLELLKIKIAPKVYLLENLSQIVQ